MKIGSHRTKFTLMFLLIVLCLLGAYFGFITYQYKIITRGILSLLLICLVFYASWLLRGEKADTLFVFPKNIKYFIFAFVWSLVLYWSIGFIVEMILFLT